MEKRGSWKIIFFIIGIVLVLILIVGMFFYFALAGPDYTVDYENQVTLGQIKNPAAGLTKEQAEARFDESFVFYLLVNIKAYNLHNPPLSSDTPKMEIKVGEDIYNAEVVSGKISVKSGELNNKDVVIVTSKEEALKMMNDSSYVQQSFEQSLSSIELVADETTLFSKGYLTIYNELTGKGVTGSVIKLYSE